MASDDHKWINGEWLFEAVLYPLYRVVGHAGISVAVALWAAAIFTLALAWTSRRMDPWLALLLTLVCWFGALHRLDARPATAAIAFPPLALILLKSTRPLLVRMALYGLLSAVWINVHPSALLAPAIAFLFFLPSFFTRRGMAETAGTTAASVAGLFANPHGIGGIVAPIHLLLTISSKRYVNTEWLPSSISRFPLLYLVVVVALGILAARFKWRRDTGLLLLFLLFATLAIRGVRSQDLFFALVPFLLGAKAEAVRPAFSERLIRLAALSALVVLIAAAVGANIGAGLDRTEFPLSAVAQLQQAGLKGTIYNADQLGGYLAWSFYPERRHLVDGRHELFDRYLAEYALARGDSRYWRGLLAKYEVTLAVDEYHPETMTVVDPETGRRRASPASQIYFPRRHWALIAFDDVAMVFARRNAHSLSTVGRLEYRLLVPDDPSALASLSPPDKEAARKELRRARERSGDQEVIRRMENVVN